MEAQSFDIDAEHLESILEAVPDLVLIVGADRRVRYINRVEPGHDRRMFLGVSADDLVGPESRGIFELHLELVLETGESTEYDVQVSMPDGFEAWYRTRMSPFPIEGDAAAVLLVARDITELKSEEKETADLRRLLPTCAWCRRVQNERGEWELVEEHLAKVKDSKAAHGLCPNCHRRKEAGWNDGLEAPGRNFGSVQMAWEAEGVRGPPHREWRAMPGGGLR